MGEDGRREEDDMATNKVKGRLDLSCPHVTQIKIYELVGEKEMYPQMQKSYLLTRSKSATSILHSTYHPRNLSGFGLACPQKRAMPRTRTPTRRCIVTVIVKVPQCFHDQVYSNRQRRSRGIRSIGCIALKYFFLKS